MDEELKDKLDQLNEEFQNEKEIFEGNRPVENGDSVIFTTDLRNEVLLGKYAADFDCVIAQDGIPYKLSHVTNWFVIPFNYIQEKLDTEALNGRYEELCSINSVEYKKIQIEDYIEENVDSVIDSLDEDTKFLVNLFTRNVRNEKIDFENYRFMIDVLLNRDYIECNENIDLRNLKTICYNMYSIMNKISKETYDKIYDMLASCASGTGEAI